MQRQKTVAMMVALIMGVTATAYALNVGVINATKPKSAAAAASLEPDVIGDTAVIPHAVGSTAAVLVPAPASAASVSYEIFSAGPAGEVVLAHTDNAIEFWAAYTANGWKYQVEVARGREVVVGYHLGEAEEAFVATVKGDRIVTVVSGPVGAPGGGENG